MKDRVALPVALLLTSSLGLLAAGMPAAQDVEMPPELARICAGERLAFSLPPFGFFDADDDQLISADEAAGCGTLELMFSRLDLDASRTLSRAEYDGLPDLWRRRARGLRDEPD